MKKNVITICSVIILLMLIFLQCSKDNNNSSSITWSKIFSDDFQRADGPIGDSFTPEVSCQGNGTADIYTNKLRFSGSGCWAIWYNGTVNENILKVAVSCTTSESSSSNNFGVTAKHKKLPAEYEQEFYGGFVMNDSLGIEKCQGMTPAVMVAKAYKIQGNHTYKLEFIVNGTKLTLNIEDVTTGVKETLTATDTGTPLTGTSIGINGYNMSTSDVFLFDDFKIDKGTN